MYSVISVPDGAYETTEPVGSKYKFWFEHDELGTTLFKEGRPETGENWAEKIAAEIASLLGLPFARYELAIWRDKQGVVTPKFVAQDSRLVLGNEILAVVSPGYDPSRRYGQSSHTVRQVATVMRSQSYPHGSDPPIHGGPVSAMDMFVGYVMLDVLIGNTDRHHQNWGFVNEPNHGIVLAPTFDHASSLGRELNDVARNQRLTTNDPKRGIAAYCDRGRSGFFGRTDVPRTLLLDEAFLAFAMYAPEAAKAWSVRAGNITDGDFGEIVDGIPDTFISEVAREFAKQLLRYKRKKLVNLGRNLP